MAVSPSARAEALGKAYTAVDGDLTTMAYNPAGTATLEGAELNASFASPYYALTEARYTFLSAGYTISPYLTVGISRNHFDMGQEFTFLDAPKSSYSGEINHFFVYLKPVLATHQKFTHWRQCKLSGLVIWRL